MKLPNFPAETLPLANLCGYSLLQEMKDLLEHGVIAPIKPYKTFDVSEIVQAMRYFGTDPHIGKVVVTYERPDSMLRIEPPKEAVQLNGDATYMIVGGLGGLGRSLTMWMLDHGARNFVFLSRSGIKSPNSEAAATIQYVKEAGGHAEAVTGDVAILEDVVRAVKVTPTLPVMRWNLLTCNRRPRNQFVGLFMLQ